MYRWVPMLLALTAVSLGVTGCKAPCEPGACPSGTFCDGTGCIAECVFNDECAPFACDPSHQCCTGRRFCDPSGRCVDEVVDPKECSTVPVFPPDGWDDRPGSGLVFIVNSAGFGGPGTGVNVDGKCGDSGCIDNALAPLAELANDQLRQFLLGGEFLLAFEIAGLSPHYRGFDQSVTVKLYAVRDADEPFFPANNFRTPPGHDRCCQFAVHPEGLDERGVSLDRFPARIVNGEIHSTEAVDVSILLPFCVPPFPRLALDRAAFSGTLRSDFRALDDIVLTGVLPVSSLAATTSPYCAFDGPRCEGFIDKTAHNFIATFAARQPDIDVDGDGRECIYDLDGNGLFDTCCDGAGDDICPGGDSPCPADRILPLDELDPATCRLSPRLADGYSFALSMSAIEASFVP